MNGNADDAIYNSQVLLNTGDTNNISRRSDLLSSAKDSNSKDINDIKYITNIPGQSTNESNIKSRKRGSDFKEEDNKSRPGEETAKYELI